MTVNNSGLKRKGIYSISEVFEYMMASPRCGQKISFHGDKIHFGSARLLNFLVHGIVCVNCGVRGAFFAKEYYKSEGAHLNLYGIDKYGGEILMTQDHIKPKSIGGTNQLHNLQPMCTECNNNKSNAWTIKDKLRYIFSVIKHGFFVKY